MLLHDLRPSFSRMNSIEQRQFISDYRTRRYNELATVSVSCRAKSQALGLTPEEKALIKRLGLRQKDVLELRK